MILNCGMFFMRCVAFDVAVSVLFLICVANADAQASRVGATFEGKSYSP
jgi:hypothetical protein